MENVLIGVWDERNREKDGIEREGAMMQHMMLSW
jgi:hypothetical protein